MIVVVFIGVSIFNSCEPKRNEKIVSIEVYLFPAGIETPVDIGDSWIDQVEPFYIKNPNTLKRIEGQISSLKRDRSSFDKKNIKMKCFVEYENGESGICEYNGFEFRINGKKYKNSPTLLKSLKQN